MKFGDIVHYGLEALMYISAIEPSPDGWRLNGFQLVGGDGGLRRSSLDWQPCPDDCMHLPSGVRATADGYGTPYSAPLTKVR